MKGKGRKKLSRNIGNRSRRIAHVSGDAKKSTHDSALKDSTNVDSGDIAQRTHDAALDSDDIESVVDSSIEHIRNDSLSLTCDVQGTDRNLSDTGSAVVPSDDAIEGLRAVADVPIHPCKSDDLESRFFSSLKTACFDSPQQAPADANQTRHAVSLETVVEDPESGASSFLSSEDSQWMTSAVQPPESDQKSLYSGFSKPAYRVNNEASGTSIDISNSDAVAFEATSDPNSDHIDTPLMQRSSYYGKWDLDKPRATQNPDSLEAAKPSSSPLLNQKSQEPSSVSLANQKSLNIALSRELMNLPASSQDSSEFVDTEVHPVHTASSGFWNVFSKMTGTATSTEPSRDLLVKPRSGDVHSGIRRLGLIPTTRAPMIQSTPLNTVSFKNDFQHAFSERARNSNDDHLSPISSSLNYMSAEELNSNAPPSHNDLGAESSERVLIDGIAELCGIEICHGVSDIELLEEITTKIVAGNLKSQNAAVSASHQPENDFPPLQSLKLIFEGILQARSTVDMKQLEDTVITFITSLCDTDTDALSRLRAIIRGAQPAGENSKEECSLPTEANGEANERIIGPESSGSERLSFVEPTKNTIMNPTVGCEDAAGDTQNDVDELRKTNIELSEENMALRSQIESLKEASRAHHSQMEIQKKQNNEHELKIRELEQTMMRWKKEHDNAGQLLNSKNKSLEAKLQLSESSLAQAKSELERTESKLCVSEESYAAFLARCQNMMASDWSEDSRNLLEPHTRLAVVYKDIPSISVSIIERLQSQLAQLSAQASTIQSLQTTIDELEIQNRDILLQLESSNATSQQLQAMPRIPPDYRLTRFNLTLAEIEVIILEGIDLVHYLTGADIESSPVSSASSIDPMRMLEIIRSQLRPVTQPVVTLGYAIDFQMNPMNQLRGSSDCSRVKHNDIRCENVTASMLKDAETLSPQCELSKEYASSTLDDGIKALCNLQALDFSNVFTPDDTLACPQREPELRSKDKTLHAETTQRDAQSNTYRLDSFISYREFIEAPAPNDGSSDVVVLESDKDRNESNALLTDFLFSMIPPELIAPLLALDDTLQSADAAYVNEKITSTNVTAASKLIHSAVSKIRASQSTIHTIPSKVDVGSINMNSLRDDATHDMFILSSSAESASTVISGENAKARDRELLRTLAEALPEFLETIKVTTEPFISIIAHDSFENKLLVPIINVLIQNNELSYANMQYLVDEFADIVLRCKSSIASFNIDSLKRLRSNSEQLRQTTINLHAKVQKKLGLQDSNHALILKLESELTGLRQQHSMVISQASIYEQSLSNAQNELSEFSSVKRTNHHLYSQNEILIDEISNLKAAERRLMTSLEESHKQITRLEECQNALQHRISQLEMIERTCETCLQKDLTINAQQEKLNTLKSKLANLETSSHSDLEREELKHTISRLTSVIAARDNFIQCVNTDFDRLYKLTLKENPRIIKRYKAIPLNIHLFDHALGRYSHYSHKESFERDCAKARNLGILKILR